DPPVVCDDQPEPIVMTFTAMAGHSYLLAVGDWGSGTTVGVGGLTQIDITAEDPAGACCVGSSCSIATAADCAGMGGAYQGDFTNCDVQTPYENLDLNLAIPDAVDPAGDDCFPGVLTDSIFINDDISITDLEVRVDIAHTWVGDLSITLTAP